MCRALIAILALTLAIGCAPEPAPEPSASSSAGPDSAPHTYTLDQALSWAESQDWALSQVSQRTGIIGDTRRPVLDFVVDAQVKIRIIQLEPGEAPSGPAAPTIGRCQNLSLIASPIPWTEAEVKEAKSNPGSFKEKYGLPYAAVKDILESPTPQRQTTLSQTAQTVLKKLKNMDQDHPSPKGE